jgi:tetratricopeptide (TPR) repeat protein
MFNPAMFESMKGMMNGTAMKQGAEMMSKMSDEQLKQYMAMTGMNIDPSFLRSASSNMAKMDESTLENLKNTTSSKLPHNPPPAPPPSEPELSKPLSLKNQGNEYFKQGKLPEAVEKYTAGIQELEKIPISKQASELEVTIRMNLANCLVKQNNYEGVIDQCKKTLILGENAKAYYRYGQALYNQGNPNKALEYLDKAKKLSPDDPFSKFYVVNSLINQIQEAQVKLKDNVIDRGVDIQVSLPEEEKKIPVDQKTQKKDPDQKKKLKNSKEKESVREKPSKIQEVPETPKDYQVKTPENLNLPNLSPEQMNKGLEDLKKMSPENISQIVNTLKTMDPRLMQTVFKSQGIDIPPEEIAKMADILTPETVSMMTSSLGKSLPGQNQSPNSSDPPPSLSSPDVSSMLNNPHLTRMASEMLAKQLGRNPDEINTVLTCLGKLLKFIMKVAYVYKLFTAGNRKYITGSALVLLLAYYFGLLNS